MKKKIFGINLLLALIIITRSSKPANLNKFINSQLEKQQNLFESPSNAQKLQEIKDNTTIPKLNFNQELEYGFYYNMTSVDDAVLMLFFENSVDFSALDFKFISKKELVNRDETMLDKFLPAENYEGDFKWIQTNNQYLYMYFTGKSGENPEGPGNPGVPQDLFIFILIKLNSIPQSSQTAELKVKQIDKKIVITEMKNITISTSSEQIPYLISFSTPLSKYHPVVFSDTPFNSYISGIDSEREVNVNFASLIESSSLIIEIFAPSNQKIVVGYTITDYIYKQIDLNDNNEITNFEYFLENRFPLQYVLSANAISAKTNKWLYFKQEIGDSVELSYTHFDLLMNDFSLPFPNKNYTINEPISISNNFYIIRPVTTFNTYFKFGIVEKMDAIIIEDKGKEAYVHVLYKGDNQNIQLNNLSGKNIKVTLIQFMTEGNKDVIISVGNDKKVLNTAITNSVVFSSIQADKMMINNPYQTLILEFKLGFQESFTEIKGTDYSGTARNIYYKFTSAALDNFIFTFDITGVKYNIEVGDLSFITKPTAFTSTINRISFKTNPYNINQPLLENEFIYIVMNIVETINPYTININHETIDFIPVQFQKEIQKETNLEVSKDKNKTKLAIVLMHCEQRSYTMNLTNSKNSVNVYTQIGSRFVEEFTFPNDYFSYSLEIEPNNNPYFVSYNYLTDIETQAYEVLSDKQLFSIKYNDKTTAITWNNINNLFSEFRLYFGEETSDLSDECKLKDIENFKEMKDKTEYVLKDNNVEFGKYKINILGYSKNNVDFNYAYKEKTINYLDIRQIDPMGEPLLIDFNTQPDGYSVNMNNYDLNEEGVLMVTFDSELSDRLISELFFKGRINFIKEEEPIYIPDQEHQSQFNYVIEQRKYIKMYLRNYYQKDDSTKIVLGIALKFPNPEPITAKVIHVKVFSSSVVVGHYPIYRQFVDLKDHIPFLFKIKRINVYAQQTLLFYSEPEVTLFKDSILNGSTNINQKETLFMKTFNDSDLNNYVAEYFGPARKAYFYFEILNDTVTWIRSENIMDVFENKCKQNFATQTEYFVGSFFDISDFNQYYIYTKQDYGLVNTYYTNAIDIKGTEKTIRPNNTTDTFVGVSGLTSPHFILRLNCKYPGDGYVQFLKPSANIILEDNDEPKVHVLIEGQHTITLKDLVDRNIEVNLVQIKQKNNNIVVTIGSKQETLSNDLKVSRFFKVTVDKMTINNPSQDAIVVEFKISFDTIQKIYGDRAEQIVQYMYYELPKKKSPYYIYEFDREINTEVKFTLTKGINTFLVKPIKNVTVNQPHHVSFNVPNPYSTYTELQSGEFWYVSIKLPNDITFHELLVKEIDDLTPIIQPNDLHSLKATHHSIETNYEKSKTNLVILLIQCNLMESQLKVYHDDTAILTQNSQSMRQVLSMENDHIPLDIKYEYSSPTSVQYHLAYNYLSVDEMNRIKSAINGNYDITAVNNTKLTWATPDVQNIKVKLYITEAVSNYNISNECEMLKLNNGIEMQTNEYKMTGTNRLAGKYRANILIEGNDKLHYVIAYNEITIDYKNPEETPENEKSNNNGVWIGVGVGIGVIALLSVGIILFLWRRNKKLIAADSKLSQLVDL